jgi:hypothetical protein
MMVAWKEVEVDHCFLLYNRLCHLHMDCDLDIHSGTTMAAYERKVAVDPYEEEEEEGRHLFDRNLRRIRNVSYPN